MLTPNNKIDFAIITTMQIELDAVLDKLGTCIDGGHRFCCYYSIYEILKVEHRL